MTAKPSLFIDVVARSGFYPANQVRRCFVGLQSDQFLLTSRYDPGDVFLQFLFAIGPDDAGTPRNRENSVDIDLRIGVSHSCQFTLRS